MSEKQEIPNIPKPSKGAKIAALIPIVLITAVIASFAVVGIGLAVMNPALPGAVLGGLTMTGACGYVLPHLTRAITEVLNDGKEDKPNPPPTDFEIETRATKSFGRGLANIFGGRSKKKTPKPNIRKTAPKPPKL